MKSDEYTFFYINMETMPSLKTTTRKQNKKKTAGLMVSFNEYTN